MFPLFATAAKHVNLDSLYKVLDAVIDSADYYLQQKKEKLEVLTEEYRLKKKYIQCLLKIYFRKQLAEN